jgi:hypothetical protein
MSEHGLAVPTAPAASVAVTAPAAADPDPATHSLAARPVGVDGLALLSLVWLGATVWAAQAAISGDSADPAAAISSAALGLPGIVAAGLLAGAATALAAVTRFAALARPVRRLAVGAAAGAAPGLVCAALILAGYGARSAVVVLAVTVGIAGPLGAVAALLPPHPLGAGVRATVGAFVAGALANLFQSPLKSLFGAGTTIASQTDAARTLSFLTALVSGLVAGAVAYLTLRRTGHGPVWPLYLASGALPGLLLLVAEGLTMAGGTGLRNVVSGLSPADLAVMRYLDAARVDHALVVMFVGGIFAMIAVGRTMRRPDSDPAEPTITPEAQQSS